MHTTFPGATTIETGQLIAGHYRLAEHVGTGAMGVVWRAVDERLERSVAVKRIASQQGVSDADRSDLHKRAMREAKIAARLQHPNAIVVYDITEHDGDPCLVMEYLPSQSLSSILAQLGTLSVATVARIGEQVASALVAAHRAGIVHRDVKPGNILLDEAGVAKLTDFGISRAHGDMTLTQTGLVGGTPAYLAPELARGDDPTPTSDVFALGATLYHAIEGQSPYGASSNQLALLHTAASGKITPPGQAGPATALLMSLLRVEPTERTTMHQASERLAAIASGGGVPAPPPPIVPAKPPTESPAESSAAGARTPEYPDREHEAADHAGVGHSPATLSATAHDPPYGATATVDAAHHDAGVTSGGSATAPPSAPPHNGHGGHAHQGPREPASPRSNRWLLFGGVGLIAAVVLALVLLIIPFGDDTQQSASPAEQPPTETSEPTETSPDDNEDADEETANEGEIEWGPAGELVIDYFTLPAQIDASWDMLTPDAQQAFEDKEGFSEHWSQFEQVYAQNARADPNDDGSVSISADVTYVEGDGERSEQLELRVVQVDGELLIDSDTRQGDASSP